MLKTHNLGINFGGLAAVQDVSLQVGQGQIVSLIGPNGAGKTTMFNLLTGYLKPTSGTIELRGETISGLAPFAIASRGLVRTFQQNKLFGNVTVRENALIGTQLARGGDQGVLAVLGGVLRRRSYQAMEQEALAICAEVLDFVGLGDRAGLLASSLPHGDQRLLGIAIALAARPQLLLLDEPIGGMNPAEAAKVMELIRKLRDSGLTILLVEHNMNVVMDISDWIIVLDHGVKIFEGLPAAVQKEPRVIEAYLGSEV